MSEKENKNLENNSEVIGSDSKTEIHHGTSTDMLKIIAVFLIIGGFVYQEYQIDNQKKTIDSLTLETTQLNNQMNTTTTAIVKAINNQQVFDQNVKQWSDLVNTHILNLYNKTGVSRP